MKTVSYTLNNTTFTFDASTGAVVRLDYPGAPSMIQEGKGLFDLSWPVHTDYDTLRLNPTEKSKPSEITTAVKPDARIPLIQICRTRFEILLPVAKLSVKMIPTKINTTSATRPA